MRADKAPLISEPDNHAPFSNVGTNLNESYELNGLNSTAKGQAVDDPFGNGQRPKKVGCKGDRN